MKKLILYFALLGWLHGEIFSQTVTILRLSAAEHSLSGSLGQVELMNHTSGSLEVYFIARGNASWMEKSRPVLLSPGLNRVDLSGLEIGNRQNGLETRREELSLCLEVWSMDNRKLASECKEVRVLPKIPPYLVYPFNGEQLGTPLPVLSWTAPAPVSGRVRYTLKLVEIQPGQTAVSAIQFQPPFLFRDDLFQQVLPYPVSARRLMPDQVYAWQVEAFSEGFSLGKTEVWTFRLKKQAPPEPKKDYSAFAELKSLPDGSIYPAAGKIKFRFDRPYNEEKVRYAIYDEQQNLVKVPEKKLQRVGDNRFILELTPGGGLRDGRYYLFVLTDAEGREQSLKFLYRDVRK